MRLPQKSLLVAASAGLLCFGSAAAATADPVAGADQDRTYLIASHQSNLTEIASGTRAMAATCGQVRDIAGMLINDHTRLDGMGAMVAVRNGVGLPLLPAEDQLGQLADVSMRMGRDFDLSWIRSQIAAHENTLRAGENELAYGSSAEVKNLAADANPVVAEHLRMLRQALIQC